MNDSNFGALVTPQFTRLRKKYAKGGEAKVGVVMREFKSKKLHSGAKEGPLVRSKKQAVAIALQEQRKKLAGKYAEGGPVSTGWYDQLSREVQDLNSNGSSQGQQMARGGYVSRK